MHVKLAWRMCVCGGGGVGGQGETALFLHSRGLTQALAADAGRRDIACMRPHQGWLNQLGVRRWWVWRLREGMEKMYACARA